MIDGTVIRPAGRDDCPGILAIYNDAVRRTTATYDYEPRTLAHRVEWLEAHQRDRYAVLVAASAAGEILGWSSLSRFHDRMGFRFTAENSVYVAEAARGRGLGRRLLEPLLEAARERGLQAVLAAIDAANEPSRRLHERLGFVEVGRFRQVGYKFGRWLDVAYLEYLVGAGPAAPAPPEGPTGG